MLFGILSIFLAFLITYLIIPKWIFRAKKAGLVGKDLHKVSTKPIAEVGGLPILAGFLAGTLCYIGLLVFISHDISHLYAIFASICSILIASIIGLVDDILGWKIGLRQFQKALISFAIVLPIMVINAGISTINLPFFGVVDFGILYPLLLLPLGIMFTANAFNMLAGYNGLEAGMGIIILVTLSLLSYLTGSSFVAVLGLCMSASLFAFLFFNWYPAQIFPGDTMTYSIGALIGIMAVLANIEKFAALLFILYVIQFLLKARGFMQKESFAKIQSDGSLLEPYKEFYGLEHVVISMIRTFKKKVYEQEVTITILSMQAVVALSVIGYFFLSR